MASLFTFLKTLFLRLIRRFGLRSVCRYRSRVVPSLVTLPDEILAQVVGELGHDFFKEDMGRLTVCKRWMPIAMDEFRSKIPLDLGDMARIRALQQSIPAAVAVDMPTWAKKRLRTLRINVGEELCDLECLFRAIIPGLPREEVNTRMQNDTIMDLIDYTPRHHVLHGMVKPGATPVFKLLEQADIFQKLEVDIRIFDWFPEPRRLWVDPPCGDAGYTMVRQLSTLQLPALQDLDLTMAYAGSFAGLRDNRGHVCGAVSRLLCNLYGLQTIYLRLSLICEEIFPREPSRTLLKAVYINCNADEGWRLLPSTRCSIAAARDLTQVRMDQEATNSLIVDLAKAAQPLLPMMKTPLIRILWPDVKTDEAVETSDPPNTDILPDWGFPEEREGAQQEDALDATEEADESGDESQETEESEFHFNDVPARLFAWDCATKQMALLDYTDDWKDAGCGRLVNLGKELGRAKPYSGVEGLTGLITEENSESESSDSEEGNDSDSEDGDEE